MTSFDACIVGAGVVGLAIARILSLNGLNVVVLERNQAIGMETSSRNSEVIHAGIYYSPGSLKARFCVEGKEKLYAFCVRHQVPCSRIGKVIVAANHAQIETLQSIYRNAETCGVFDIEWWDQLQLRQQESEVSGKAALFSPSTGIIDSHAFMAELRRQAEANSALISLNTDFLHAEKHGAEFTVAVNSVGEAFRFQCRYLINAAGLSASAVAARIDGLALDSVPAIHLCKGSYFSLSGKSPFAHLIYPVPEANTTGLGVHATLDLGGQVKFGPDVEYIAGDSEFGYAVNEKKKSAFLEAIRRYFPAIEAQRLQPAYAGIRPKLQKPGEPPCDFRIDNEKVHGIAGLVCLYGIESPGLTGSLAIAEYVREILNPKDSGL